MPIKNVCRLCLMANDLIWVFDKQFDSSENMRHVVYITTGVEITANDIISQKICKKCQSIIIRIFEFRKTALRNDQKLKEQSKILLKNKDKTPNTEVIVTDKEKNIPKIKYKEGNNNPKKNSVEPKKGVNLCNKIHPSTRALFKMYPQIRLPSECLKYNIDPRVCMKMDQVEQYFKSRNLDIQKYIKHAMRSGNTACKKTSSLHKAKKSTSSIVATGSKTNRTKEKVETKDQPLKIIPHSPLSSENIVHPNNKCNENNFVQNIKEQSSSKRKCVEGDKMEENNAKKCNIIECLELFGFKLKQASTASPSYVASKSEPLFICQICNSVQYNAKDLKKHKNIHLRCQFCKMKFRSFKNKDKHLNSMCIIKNMMNNLPHIKLQKVELNKGARISYPNAFDIFSSNVEDAFTNVSSIEDHSSIIANDDASEKKTITLESEVVDIKADEEDIEELLSVNATQQIAQIITTPNTGQSSHIENSLNNTVSIVPKIKINNNCALNVMNIGLTDTQLLKNLLTHYKPAELHVEKSIQTELMTEPILLDRVGMAAELKQLKQQLYVYNIPVVIKNGIFNVSYSYNVEQKKEKKLCFWNDLNVVDIRQCNVKTSANAIPNENVNNYNILPSRAETYKSTGVTNSSTQFLTPTTSKFNSDNVSFLSPVTTALNSRTTRNSQKNNTVQNTISLATTMTQTSNENTLVDNRAQQFGNIRVKTVWELT